MSVNWNWQQLVTAILAAIIGWLTNVVVPVPGTGSTPAPAANSRLK